MNQGNLKAQYIILVAIIGILGLLVLQHYCYYSVLIFLASLFTMGCIYFNKTGVDKIC